MSSQPKTTSLAAVPKDEALSQPQYSSSQDEENTLSAVEKPQAVSGPSPPPNGGLVAWLQVAGAFFLMFNSWGIINTFGVYETYYETGQLFQSSSSTISWVGTVQIFILLAFGVLTGPLFDAGYLKLLLCSGTFLIVFGHMMLSLCHELWQVMLAQAFCIGLGCACFFVPGVAVVSTYFSTRMVLAIGIASSGSSLGGVIYPIVFYRLVDRIGFAWSTRVLGFIALATLALPCLTMKMRVTPPTKRALIDWAAFKDPTFLVFTTGAFFGFMGLFIPFFYIQIYAISEGATNENLGFYLLAILNSASIFGRLLPNLIADKVGTLNMFIPCTVLTAVLTLCLIAAHNEAGIIVIVIVFGFFSGSFVSLTPSVFVQLTPNRALIGTRMGMGFTVAALGALIGAPIGGVILGDGDNFTGIWIFSGVFVLAASVCYTLTRFIKTQWKLIAKA